MSKTKYENERPPTKRNNFSMVYCFQHYLESLLRVMIKFDMGAWQLWEINGGIHFSSISFRLTLGVLKDDVPENANIWLLVSGQACIQSSQDLVERCGTIVGYDNFVKIDLWAFLCFKSSKILKNPKVTSACPFQKFLIWLFPRMQNQKTIAALKSIVWWGVWGPISLLWPTPINVI